MGANISKPIAENTIPPFSQCKFETQTLTSASQRKISFDDCLVRKFELQLSVFEIYILLCIDIIAHGKTTYVHSLFKEK